MIKTTDSHLFVSLYYATPKQVDLLKTKLSHPAGESKFKKR